MISTKKILIIAGEASGDLHGAKLVKDLHAINPDIEFYGMGGTQMEKAGVRLLVKTAKLSIIGFLEVFSKIIQILIIFNKLRLSLKKEKPDLVILIDYPEFNLRFAKIAKRQNLKVLYYISPQIWAWRKKRIKIVKKNVDHMAVIFPFEVEFYRKENVAVSFVGHPLVEVVKTTMNTYEAKSFFNLKKENQTLIGLMPGSRFVEIKFILPIILKAAAALKNANPHVQFILPLAPILKKEDLQPYLQQYDLNIQIVNSHHYDAMQLCDAIIVASGTATLEIALLGIPMVIVYKGSSLSFAIAKKLVKIPYVGLCNIIANKKIIQELLQQDATTENIVKEIKSILEDKEYLSAMKENLRTVKKLLCETEHQQLAPTIKRIMQEY